MKNLLNTMCVIFTLFFAVNNFAQTADLEINQFVISDTTPDEGQSIEYTLKVKNKGPNNATGVQAQFVLPSSLTYVSQIGSGTYNSTTGIWTIGGLTNGTTVQMKITVTVNNGTSGDTIFSTVSIYASSHSDPISSNNTATISLDVNTADLQLTKQVDDATPDEGQVVQFTLKVKNNGPALATSIIANDLLPAGLTWQSDDSAGAYNNVTGDWTIGTVVSGVTVQIKILALVDVGTGAQTITNNFCLVSFDQYDDNEDDNFPFVELIVNGADLQITKTVNDTNPAAGDTITYTIVVYNNGPLKATNIFIEDQLSNRFTFVSSTETQGLPYDTGTELWFVGDLNAGASATLTIDVLVENSAIGKLVNNIATIFSANEADSITDNNTASVDIGVGTVDIQIIKTVNVPIQNEGGTVVYTIEVKNNSATINAHATSITDVLPEDVTYVSDDALGAYDPVTGIWDAGNVGAATSKFLNIICTVNSGTGGTIITNTASGSSIMEDPNTADNTDSASFQVNGADLEIDIAVDVVFPSEFQTIVYTITVTNNGPLNTTGVEVLDHLPFSVDWDTYTASQGTYDFLTGIWNVGAIANGASATIDISAIVRLSGSFINTASISNSNQNDGNSSNDIASIKVSAKRTFDAGAAIIDMGIAPQTYNNGLIPYGLVYELAINQLIPIYWIIDHTKTWVNPNAKQDQTDLVIDGKAYRGGPFVIPEEYMSIAEPIIDQWMIDYPGLTVDKNLPAFESYFYDYISSFPRAVLDTQNGDKVQDAFYDYANVPITFGRIGEPGDLTICDDIYTMPHADPQNWDATTVNTLIDFIENGGYFWAACHAVSAMEGAVDTDNDGNPDLNLLSKNGLVLWGDHGNGTPPYSYNTDVGIFNGSETAGDPLMQFIGTMDGALQSGSEQIYIPLEGGWRDSTVLALTDEDHPEVIDGTYPTGPAVALAYGRAFGVDTNGMVMYEASHKISGGTEAEDVAAARVYGNFLLQAGIERRPDIKIERVTIITPTDELLPLVSEVSGIAPPFTYQWTDTCGGSFDDPTSNTPNYIPNINIIGPQRCLLRLIVTDDCGRRNFTSFYVWVEVDTDDDGIVDSIDLDDDNDGILDVVEENGDIYRDTDGDGIVDRIDLDADGDGIFDVMEGGLTPAQIAFFDTDQDGFIDLSFTFGPNGVIDDLETIAESGIVDFDGNGLQDDYANNDSDAFYNFQDIDADNDGIPDNVEAQLTIGYVQPDASYSQFGVNNAYPNGFVLTDTDGDGIPDFIDTDSDADGIPDIQENGMANTLLNTDTDSDGLDNIFEGSNINDNDINDEIDSPESSILPDSDGDLYTGGDLDYRDLFNVNPPVKATLDFDGVDDYVDSDLDMGNYPKATVMAWVKLDPSFSQRGYVLSYGGLKIEVDNNRKAKFRVNHIYADFSNDFILDVNVWYHMALVFDSSLPSNNLKAYVNGKLIGVSSHTDLWYPITSEAVKFNIGKRSYDNNRFFKGCIDEVRVFNITLSEDQMKKIIHQEIVENSGSVSGLIIPKTIVDNSTSLTISWENLKAYYPMTDIKTSKTSDYSGKGNTATLHNITTLQAQTAPMPYRTKSAGNINDNTNWLYGDVWDMDVLSDSGYAIIKVDHNITVDKTFKTLGLLISAGKSITVNNTNEINNSWYLGLDGTIDLKEDSQLIQGIQSDLVTSANGKILRRQEGASSHYWYNYWSSPVGKTGITTLTDNNSFSNNVNNSAFNLEMLKDENGNDVTFTSAYNETGKLSTRWMYTYENGVTYYDWGTVTPTTNINSGIGYIHKGTGVGSEQQYIFEGKPNNGTIKINVMDVGGSGSVPGVSKTEYLLGNPYASALDINKFIDDNASVLEGSLQLWQQWAGTSHTTTEYEGGYAQVNKTGSVRAFQFVGGLGANNGSQDGTKTPTKYLTVGQSFIAEIKNTGTLEFNNSQRVFVKEADANGSYYTGSVFFRTTESMSQGPTMRKLRLEFNALDGQATRRELLLGFSNITTDGYDYGYEAKNTDDNHDDLNLLLDGEHMSIQSYGEITADKVVPLGLKTSGNNSYSIQLSATDNMEEDQEVYLKDNLTDTYFDLRQNTAYTFTSEAGVFNERFEIVFSSQILSVEEVTANNNTVIYYNNNSDLLYVKGLNTEVSNLRLINMLGQTVYTKTNVSNNTIENGMPISKLATGVYFVSIKTNENQTIDKKIVIE